MSKFLHMSFIYSTFAVDFVFFGRKVSDISDLMGGIRWEMYN